jgi:biotin synthase
MNASVGSALRTDWSRDEIELLFGLPFNDLLFRAHGVHRQHFPPNTVQLSTLLSIKTGACPEDCKYCPQSTRYDTGLDSEALIEIERVIQEARAAREGGATRFCMGAAWRSPKDRDMPKLTAMVGAVKALGMETCMTLGMLSAAQARELAGAGLDYYNHNIDTSPEYYDQIITTRVFQQRLDTLAHVRDSGMKVCCGGILGMGEARADRIGMLHSLATLRVHPESVPINLLVKVAGTPLAGQADLDPFEFIRSIAVARILMPASYIRLSAGRENMSDEMQALAFFAGANSIFKGDKLLTTPNPGPTRDQQLFQRLGLRALGGSDDGDSMQDTRQPPVEGGQSQFYDAAAV